MEQQRRFIYLRQTGSGRESGYARLENTDGAWKLSIVVQGFPPEAQAAALLWSGGGLRPIGTLRFDQSGRGGLTTSVNPQEVAQASLLAVIREDNGQKTIPLAAVPGHGEPVTLQTVLEALNPPVRQEEPPRVTTVREVSANADPGLAAIVETESELLTPVEPEKESDLPESLRAVYWPERSWPMVDLFEKFPVTSTPGGQQNRVCVRIPLTGSGPTPDHYLLGVEIEDGQVVALGMLLPGLATDAEYSSMPDYVWNDGYWQLWQPISD